MRFICKKNILAANINIVSKAVASKANMPIIECCLLKVDFEGLKLIANNLEMAIETQNIEVEIIEKGEIALEARIFFDIVRRMPGDTVEISCDDKLITTIKSNNSEFKILGTNSDEFPSLPNINLQTGLENNFIINSEYLKDMIRQTIFSVSTDPSKPVLCGELLEIKDNCAKLVSVDGFRISLKQVKGDFKLKGKEIKVIISSKVLSDITKIVNNDEDIKVTLTDKHIIFYLNSSTLYSTIIEGEFINYENMFIKDNTTIIEISKTELLESIERASIISKDNKKNPVKLKLTQGQVIITSNAELGNVYEEVDADQDGPEIEIAFNPRYLTDVLKVIDSEKVKMYFSGTLSPCFIMVPNSEEYKYLVLPLRLR